MQFKSVLITDLFSTWHVTLTSFSLFCCSLICDTDRSLSLHIQAHQYGGYIWLTTMHGTDLCFPFSFLAPARRRPLPNLPSPADSLGKRFSPEQNFSPKYTSRYSNLTQTQPESGQYQTPKYCSNNVTHGLLDYFQEYYNIKK